MESKAWVPILTPHSEPGLLSHSTDLPRILARVMVVKAKTRFVPVLRKQEQLTRAIVTERSHSLELEMHFKQNGDCCEEVCVGQ